jgi:ribose 5-phosphate isomerase B
MDSSAKPQSKKTRIALGADHAGYQVKESIKPYLTAVGYSVSDTGTWSEDSVDYPDFAVKVARRVQQGQEDPGILAWGTGIGMAMAANKVGGIRAAVAHDERTAHLSGEHIDVRVLALGARVLSERQI